MNKNRERHSNPQLECLPIEDLVRLRRGLSMEVSSVIDDENIHDLRSDQLLKAIHIIEKEKKELRLENILYSRYLRRINSSKIIETYDDYEDESDVIRTETHLIINPTTVHAKLPEIARRFSVKKSSIHSTKSSPLWSKLVTNWREYIYTTFLLRVEQEKLSIAAYEIEQTQLDWDRMKLNAHLTLDHLDDLLRSAESDEIAQETLIEDFKTNVNKFRHYIKEEKLINSRFIVPGALVINRINKRIESRISLIGHLRINSTHMQYRIRTLDIIIHDLDDLRDQMDEIDLNFVRTRKNDYLDIYEKLDRKYRSEKCSQYPLLNYLQKWKKILFEQEQEKLDYDNKCQVLENYYEKFQQEIQSIQLENNLISNENLRMKNRIIDVKKVPTITDYAHINKQIRTYQHAIYIWTQRVNIAQVSLLLFNYILVSFFYFDFSIRHYSYN